MAAPAGSRKEPGLHPEQSGCQPRSRRGRVAIFAALSGRDRVMAETYGRGGGRTFWGLGPGKMRPVYGAGPYMSGGGACIMGQSLEDAGRV